MWRGAGEAPRCIQELRGNTKAGREGDRPTEKGEDGRREMKRYGRRGDDDQRLYIIYLAADYRDMQRITPSAITACNFQQ